MLLSINHALTSEPKTSCASRDFARVECSDDVDLLGVGRLAFASGDAAADGMLDGVALLGRAAMLLDRSGMVTCMNAAAANLYPAALGVRGGRLFARCRSAEQSLRALISCAISPVPPHEHSTCLAVRLPRLNGKHPLLARAMPLSTATVGICRYAAAVLFLIDPNRHHGADPEMLQTAFGLTRAEARLAGILASGTDLSEAADQLGISRLTTRSHLRSIFAKTGTCRQGELVALLSRVAG
ncbi:helix-turn-helix transcriptional regulator [Lichenihabitans sp. Uapishka_5]|uniref:helix-turn-helix transcriptional regulator n=1 Tax=Lichenihabitans sp. Uapishka_5 TaxID=3037302 RepID=UPI0029E7EC9F|nr:helix-turn-helix transcriptional regulator [Lichenihabitans sp. Uapishka_5]MDX7953426.1 helix-turn-helix transcriptional regulator [Lichenihabitans sp. Uapishka_5]